MISQTDCFHAALPQTASLLNRRVYSRTLTVFCVCSSFLILFVPSFNFPSSSFLRLQILPVLAATELRHPYVISGVDFDVQDFTGHQTPRDHVTQAALRHRAGKTRLRRITSIHHAKGAERSAARVDQDISRDGETDD